MKTIGLHSACFDFVENDLTKERMIERLRRLSKRFRQENSKGKIYKKLIKEKLLPKRGQFSLLDVGCNDGDNLNLIRKKNPKAEIAGIDLDWNMIREAKRKYGSEIKFFVHDVNIDTLPRTYDYIVFIQTMMCLDFPRVVVNKYLNYCRKMIITVSRCSNCKKDKMMSVRQFDEKYFEGIDGYKKTVVMKGVHKNDSDILVYYFEK